MSAFASVITPFDASPAIELGNQWRKRILPIGSIQYQNRELHFTREYLQGLVRAWQDRAHDAVPIQFADDSNRHTLDPERTRGQIVDMQLADDGLCVTAELSERGQRTLAEHPYIGCSARIVEQYQRADGKFYPAAVQHVLATTDPRVPGLGAWEPVNLSNESAVVIDLSNLSFAGQPAPAAPADPFGGLSDSELGDLLDAMAEVGLLDGYDDTEGTMYGQDYSDAAEQFDAAFNERYAAAQAREDARAAAQVEDTLHPARRDEDRMQRIISRAGQGVYSGQQMSFSAESAAVEIMLSNGGAGPCGPPDAYGRCSSRYHDLECSHGQSVDWAASGPHPATGVASLANLADDLDLNLTPRSVWGDPDDPDEPSYEVPAATVELAHQLSQDWGLGDVPQGAAYDGLMRMPAAPVSVYDELLDGAGLGGPAPQQQSWPGISELARTLGLR